MNALTKAADAPATVTQPGNPMMPRSMDQAMRLAELMCQGKLVPTHLQNSPGDCLLVIEQSMRWGMSPFAVAQATSVVKGRLNFEGKLVAAALNSSGALASRLDYKFSGTGEALKCEVSATLHGETEPRKLTVEYAKVKTTNEWWVKQPEQQLSYSAARNWGRRFAPEVMLGVYTPEEFDDAPQQFSGTTIDATAETVKSEPAMSATNAPTKKTLETVDGLINKVVSCEAQEEWLDYDTKSQNYRDKLKRNHPQLSDNLEAAFEDARKRLFPDPDPMEGDGATAEGESLPPEDKDSAFSRDLMHQFQAAKTVHDLSGIAKNAAVASWRKRVEKERPELYNEVGAAYAQREADFKGPDDQEAA
jgi:hypothetical protein